MYDTASSWVTVSDVDTNGVEIISNYDITESKNAHPVWLDNEKTQRATQTLNYGTFWIDGEEYSDNICLNQNRVDRRDDTGRLCVRNMPFLAAKNINGGGTFKSMGIVGLGPNNKDKSYVQHLCGQGQIRRSIVGLNFEDPSDKQQVSTVSFGFIDYGEIQGVEEGFNYYTNVG